MRNDTLVIGTGLVPHNQLYREKCEVVRTFESFRNLRMRAGLKSQDGWATRKTTIGTSTPKPYEKEEQLRRELKTANSGSNPRTQPRISSGSFGFSSSRAIPSHLLKLRQQFIENESSQERWFLQLCQLLRIPLPGHNPA